MRLTIKDFVLRGLAAGALGGLANALFIRFVTEKQIDIALLFEDATGIGLPPGEAAQFARSTQQWGGMAAAMLYGAVLGMVLGIATASLHHRLTARDEFGRVAKVAVGIFLATSLLPGLKYPANPPTVGNPDTIAQRTADYLSFMAASIIIVFAAFFLWQRLTAQGLRGGTRFLVGGGAFAVLVTAAMLLWPASPDQINPPDNEAAPALQISDDAPADVLDGVLATARETGDEWIRDPSDPSAPLDLDGITDSDELRGAPAALSTTELVPHSYTTTVWRFRIQSLGGVALMWAVAAGALGLLLDRKAGEEPAPETERVAVPA